MLKENPPGKKMSPLTLDKRHALFFSHVTAGSPRYAVTTCLFLVAEICVQDFRLKFVHYKIGHRVTIMSGASVTCYRKMKGCGPLEGQKVANDTVDG